MIASQIQQASPLYRVYQVLISYPVPLLLALVLIYSLRNKYLRGLYSIPGPALAGWTPLWRVWDVYQGQAHVNSIQLHQKHGKLVRIAPNVISVGDRAEIANIYGRGEGYIKTAFYPLQSISWRKKPALNIFSEREPSVHRQEKRKVANAYALSSVLQLEDKVDNCGMLFMRRLEEDFESKGKPVDLGTWLQYYAFDVIGEITFASKLGFLERGKDVDGMMHAIEGMLTYSAVIGQVPWMHKILLGNPLFTLFMPAMEKWNQVLMFTLKALNSRGSIKRDGDLINAETGGKDMLSRWAYVQSNDPLKMETKSIVVHTSTNVFAGSDTTAIALRAIIYYLLKTEGEMHKVVAELATADNDGKLSQPISYRESTEHLLYLGAAIKEALRLHSSVGLIMERHVPPGGTVICEKYIPGGTIVGINPWVINYDQTIFPCPYAFKPSRWITAREEQLREMENAWQLIFGGGSRVCLGRNISMVEIHKIIPQLLRTYIIELDKPEKEWTVKNHWFTQQKGLVCRLKKRNNE